MYETIFEFWYYNIKSLFDIQSTPMPNLHCLEHVLMKDCFIRDILNARILTVLGLLAHCKHYSYFKYKFETLSIYFSPFVFSINNFCMLYVCKRTGTFNQTRNRMRKRKFNSLKHIFWTLYKANNYKLVDNTLDIFFSLYHLFT